MIHLTLLKYLKREMHIRTKRYQSGRKTQVLGNALISALSDPEDDDTLYSIGINTLNFIEISEDKFTSIIKINEVIELIDDLNHMDNYVIKGYMIEKEEM